MLAYAVIMLLVALGLYAMLFKKNLIKIIIGVTILETGVNLFLITLGYVKGGYSPIFTLSPSTRMVLPTPQALTLTSIVIGLATTALMLSLVIMVYKNYKTLNTRELRGLLRD